MTLSFLLICFSENSNCQPASQMDLCFSWVYGFVIFSVEKWVSFSSEVSDVKHVLVNRMGYIYLLFNRY